MPAIFMSDPWIKGLPIPTEGKGDEYSDAKAKGLGLRVMPSGKKLWSVRYKPLGSTKPPKRFPLGEYPAVSLTKARDEAVSIKSAAKKVGADPAGERDAIRAKRRQAESDTFNIGVALDAFVLELKTRKATWEQDVGHINRDVRSRWATRKPGDIAKADCAALLAEVKARTPSGANYVRLVMIAFFNWAVEQGHLTVSPMIGIPRPTKKKKGAKRALDDAEIVVLWRAIEAATMDDGLRDAFQCLFLTGQRANEIAGLATAELHHLDDERQARVDFPAERMKARRQHVLPLSRSVIAIIKARLAQQVEDARIVGRNSLPDFVFESKFYSRSRIARHSLSQAMRRIIDDLDPNGPDDVVVKRLQGNRPTPHALRRTFVTGLARLGIPREDRKACVAHAEDDVLEESYDAYDRLHEKRIAMETWALHIAALLSGEKSTGATIVSITARR